MEHRLPATIALPIQLRVLSQTPDRLRVRLAQAYWEPEVMEQIALALQQLMDSVQRVKTNPQTGSLTLYLGAGQESWETIVGPLEEMGVIAIAADAADLPSASQQLTGLMASWNQRVNQWTEGTADLRFLMPMALAILALRRLLAKGGGLQSAPWYILAWYAFDSFIKLNSPQTEESDNVDRHPKTTKSQIQKLGQSQ
ncbi:MAG TPA: hypothetical protein V6C46_05455 [Coleofasciculaceae cyanobacterium]